MPEMIFLSEYTSQTQNRSAWVCRRPDIKDYIVIGYINGLERIGHPFPTEQEADDFAEDWVLLTTSE